MTAADLHRVARAKLDRRCTVIALNDAVYLAWWADHLHAADAGWWRAHYNRVHAFPGMRSTIGAVPPQWRVRMLNVSGVDGYDDTPGNVRTGNGSGYQALHIALQARPQTVLLLGYDMAGPNWYDPAGGERTDYNSTMRPHFDSLVAPAKERGVDVVNCSMESRLECFRKEPLANFL